MRTGGRLAALAPLVLAKTSSAANATRPKPPNIRNADLAKTQASEPSGEAPLPTPRVHRPGDGAGRSSLRVDAKCHPS